MIISSITPHPKRPAQHQLTLEDGRVITVREGALTQFFLYPGKDIAEAELESLLEANDQQKVRSRALRLLDYRAMSRKELIDKLVEKGEDPELAADAADWLLEIGQLDDAEYAASIVRHYGAKGYGRRRIESELWRRGIEKDDWDAAFLELPEEAERDALIDQFIRSKLRGAIPDRKEEKRVTDALARRGYAWDEVGAAMRRYRESLGDIE